MANGRYIVLDPYGQSVGGMDPEVRVIGDCVFSSWKTEDEAFAAAGRIAERDDAPEGPYRVGFILDTVVLVPQRMNCELR